MNRYRILVIGLLLFFPTTFATAQDSLLNKYGLLVISNTNQLKKTIAGDSRKLMIDIKKAMPGVVLDLRYASKNNFMHTQLYPNTKTSFLRKPAAEALKQVQAVLNKKGMSLKIFDAYRPYSVTEKMWEPVKDDRYAADPKKGSGHNRGTAVDLTIINLQTGAALDMGTGFDNFSDTAHHDFANLPPAVIQNRQLLKTTMEAAGFKALDTEWWHYSLPNAKDYELMDITFSELEKMQKKKKNF